jgi:hypothetical protein
VSSDEIPSGSERPAVKAAVDVAERSRATLEASALKQSSMAEALKQARAATEALNGATVPPRPNLGISPDVIKLMTGPKLNFGIDPRLWETITGPKLNFGIEAEAPKTLTGVKQNLFWSGALKGLVRSQLLLGASSAKVLEAMTGPRVNFGINPEALKLMTMPRVDFGIDQAALKAMSAMTIPKVNYGISADMLKGFTGLGLDRVVADAMTRGLSARSFVPDLSAILPPAMPRSFLQPEVAAFLASSSTPGFLSGLKFPIIPTVDVAHRVQGAVANGADGAGVLLPEPLQPQDIEPGTWKVLRWFASLRPDQQQAVSDFVVQETVAAGVEIAAYCFFAEPISYLVAVHPILGLLLVFRWLRS